MNYKFVVLGGGHGLSRVLLAFKTEPYIKAIVSCANSGGSSGKLRRSFNSPAMGDVRKCLTTVSVSPLAKLFETRTDNNDCLGNLIIGGLFKLYGFKIAINVCHELLDIPENKEIIPISLNNYDIVGVYESTDNILRKTCFNETDFNQIAEIKTIGLAFHQIGPEVNSDALKAIKEANYIILAPGSFYTSVLVNLQFKEIVDLLKNKPVIWITNLMQEKYETLNFTLNKMYDILKSYGVNIVAAIINNRKPTAGMLSKYEDYLKPLIELEVKNLIIIKKPLLACQKGVLVHNLKTTYNGIAEAIIEHVIKSARV